MLIVCETVAAITTHLRRLEPGEKPNYNGTKGKKLTLCGSRVGWDLQYDSPETVRCSDCRKIGLNHEN